MPLIKVVVSLFGSYLLSLIFRTQQEYQRPNCVGLSPPECQRDTGERLALGFHVQFPVRPRTQRLAVPRRELFSTTRHSTISHHPIHNTIMTHQSSSQPIRIASIALFSDTETFLHQQSKFILIPLVLSFSACGSNSNLASLSFTSSHVPHSPERNLQSPHHPCFVQIHRDTPLPITHTPRPLT